MPPGLLRRLARHLVLPSPIATESPEVFLDPPYTDTADRTTGLYAKDCGGQGLSPARKWAIKEGLTPHADRARGYDGEHQMPDNWRVIEWKTKGGYMPSSRMTTTRAVALTTWPERQVLTACQNGAEAGGLFA